MIAKFEHSGTHVHKGKLKVGIALYPEPADKLYAEYYLELPIIPPEGYQGAVDEFGHPIDEADYDNWLSSLPTVWVVTSPHCHFVTVSPDITAQELDGLAEDIFDEDTVAEMDDGKSVGHIMRAKVKARPIVTLPSQANEAAIIATMNNRLPTKEYNLKKREA